MMITEGTVVIAVEYVARGQIMFLIKTNQGEEKDFFFSSFYSAGVPRQFFLTKHIIGVSVYFGCGSAGSFPSQVMSNIS